MSHFGFGVFRSRLPLDETERRHLAWAIHRAAVRHEMCLVLGYNIQQGAFGTLREQGLWDESLDVPYMLALSPLDNTSDELLDPIGDESETEVSRAAAVSAVMHRLQALYEELLSREDLAKIVLIVVCESFDDEFTVEQIDVTSLVSKVMLFYDPASSTWESVRLDIGPKSSQS